jgi:hypothetical protein
MVDFENIRLTIYGNDFWKPYGFQRSLPYMVNRMFSKSTIWLKVNHLVQGQPRNKVDPFYFCLYHCLPQYRSSWLLTLSWSASLAVEIPVSLEAIQRTRLLQVHENSKLSGSYCNPWTWAQFEKLLFARLDTLRAVSIKLQADAHSYGAQKYIAMSIPSHWFLSSLVGSIIQL